MLAIGIEARFRYGSVLLALLASVAFLFAGCNAYDPDLVEWDGEDGGGVPGDASSPDGDGGYDFRVTECQPNPDDDGTCPERCPEQCDGKDNDCDGKTDEGEADDECELDNAVVACEQAACVFVECESGFGNCDDDETNGCERPLDTSENCGECDASCTVLDHATGAQCVDGVCSPTDCDYGYDNCDGEPANGCEAKLDTLQNCGGCEVACDGASCAGGVCSTVACEADTADCDGDPANGCETSLSTTSDCGFCNSSCSPPNATAECNAGACQFIECKSGFGDCDQDVSNGCETSLTTLTDCGACGQVCEIEGGTPGCFGGACTAENCEEGTADCDGKAGNGCETSLTTLKNCGMCGAPCGPFEDQSVSCDNGFCEIISCDPGTYDCDQNPDNGCESDLTDLDNCGECGNVCDLNNATEKCADGKCEILSCNQGYKDCNDTHDDGCEIDLNSNRNCGDCDVSCDRLEHATAGCVDMRCVVSSCDADWGNCDNNHANGCEAQLGTPENCGSCGDVCTVIDKGPYCCKGKCTWSPLCV